MYVCVNVIHLLFFFFFYNKEGNQNVEFSFKRKHKAAHSVAVVPRGGGRRLQLLGLAVFWFGLWRGVRVLGLLLVHPHVGVQASLEQQLIVSLDGEKVNHSEFGEKKRVYRMAVSMMLKTTGHTYRPLSAIRPSLITRIWSAPIMVDNL